MYDLRVTITTLRTRPSQLAAAVTQRSVNFHVGVASESFDRVALAFRRFRQVFTGRMPGYHASTTLYHVGSTRSTFFGGGGGGGGTPFFPFSPWRGCWSAMSAA